MFLINLSLSSVTKGSEWDFVGQGLLLFLNLVLANVGKVDNRDLNCAKNHIVGGDVTVRLVARMTKKS